MVESFAAIGDSFTEGVGDELPDGTLRGWADLVAQALADAQGGPLRYANLAVRGRKLHPVIDEQLAPAIALRPELLSINGGGNDLMRPRADVADIAATLDAAAESARREGIRVLMVTGANPSAHMPLGALVRRRGERLAREIYARFPREDVLLVDNWRDDMLGDARYWSADHIHPNAAGHARVAANVLTRLRVPVPEEWGVDEVARARPGAPARRTAAYYRDYVLPWVGRRLTGRSSGDGRTAKLPELTPVSAETADS